MSSGSVPDDRGLRGGSLSRALARRRDRSPGAEMHLGSTAHEFASRLCVPTLRPYPLLQGWS